MNAGSIENGLVGSRVSRLAGTFCKAQVIALTYPSVLNQRDRDFITLGRIMSSMEVFRKYTELISRDYVPVSLDDILLFERGEKEIPARAVAVRFDDGDLDNDSEGAPVIHNQSPTFYVALDCIETGKMPWPSRLRHAFFTTRRTGWLNHTSDDGDGGAAQAERSARAGSVGRCRASLVLDAHLAGIAVDKRNAVRLRQSWRQQTKHCSDKNISYYGSPLGPQTG